MAAIHRLELKQFDILSSGCHRVPNIFFVYHISRKSDDFYRAMRMHSADCRGKMSVCPFVRRTPVFCLNGYVCILKVLSTIR